MKLIDKDTLVTRIKKLKMDIGNIFNEYDEGFWEGRTTAFDDVICALDTIEMKDPYEQRIQYPSVKDGIKAHAETYSFNIESELFNQLTKEQQALWVKEIEQACISGGEAGVELARDLRYKENLEVKEVDYERELSKYVSDGIHRFFPNVNDDYCKMDSVIWQDYVIETAKHFFELGLKAQKGE